MLFALSGQIATALQNARYVERIAQSLKETQIRLTITQALGEAQTVRAVIDTVMNHGDAPEGVSALLALAEGDLGRAGFRAVGHLPPDSALGRREPDAMLLALCNMPDFVDLLAGHGELSTQYGSDDERLPEAARNLLSAAGADQLLALPLRNRGQWLGVLLVAARVPFCLDEDLRFRYRMLAEQGVGALYQAQLRDRLNLTQFSVDEAPMAILWIRPDGTLSEANDTACTLLGYTRAELLALPAIGRLDPNMIPRVWDAHWEKVRRERRFSILTEYRTKDGTLIPVEVTANYLRYDGEEYNCVFARMSESVWLRRGWRSASLCNCARQPRLLSGSARFSTQMRCWLPSSHCSRNALACTMRTFMGLTVTTWSCALAMVGLDRSWSSRGTESRCSILTAWLRELL